MLTEIILSASYFSVYLIPTTTQDGQHYCCLHATVEDTEANLGIELALDPKACKWQICFKPRPQY